jgi:hypothetical protein
MVLLGAPGASLEAGMWRRGLSWLFAVTVSVAAVGVVAAESPVLFTLLDPKGDDWGDGSLLYPLREDLVPGDLDILSVSARDEGNGTVFEVTFARQVRQPWRQTVDGIGTSLDQIAKLGFYTFNVDIYIDTDRLPGSGSTIMLPGRRATVDAKFAWEKAICLTPRPYEAKNALQSIFEREAKGQVRKDRGRVDASDKKTIESGAAQEIASSVFFPTLVWVKGSRVSFFVPRSFLGAPASPKWAYVVAVSGADLNLKVDLTRIAGSKEETVSSLMILPVKPGKAKEVFGGAPDDDDLMPPLVDILVPKGMSQEKILKDYDLRTGRGVALPGVVPAEQ